MGLTREKEQEKKLALRAATALHTLHRQARILESAKAREREERLKEHAAIGFASKMFKKVVHGMAVIEHFRQKLRKLETFETTTEGNLRRARRRETQLVKTLKRRKAKELENALIGKALIKRK